MAGAEAEVEVGVGAAHALQKRILRSNEEAAQVIATSKRLKRQEQEERAGKERGSEQGAYPAQDGGIVACKEAQRCGGPAHPRTILCLPCRPNR